MVFTKIIGYQRCKHNNCRAFNDWKFSGNYCLLKEQVLKKLPLIVQRIQLAARRTVFNWFPPWSFNLLWKRWWNNYMMYIACAISSSLIKKFWILGIFLSELTKKWNQVIAQWQKNTEIIPFCISLARNYLILALNEMSLTTCHKPYLLHT